MTELFPDTLPDLDAQIAELRREIGQRERAYPRFIATGMLTKGRADRQMAALRGALDTLERIREGDAIPAARQVLGRCLRALCVVAALATSALAQERARVVDGDTIAVGGETIRIMGLDAPEMHARCPREWHLARLATARLTALVRDGVALERHGRDRYGRVLAVVRTADGQVVAEVMIAEGLARPYDGRSRRRSWCDA